MLLTLPALALFIIMAGFVVGLGATTVIDTLGFLGRSSPYWSSVTHRAHRVTKPLIWLGALLYIAGLSLWYSTQPLLSIGYIQYALAGVLVLNGAFLSFVVSPMLQGREAEGKDGELLPAQWQRRIAVSFLISFSCWWASVLLFVYMLLSFMRPGSSLFIA